ncbi:MAG TPA: hypothetical protein VH878_10245 [Thermodesulfobacteriota bacterium]
MSKIRISYLLIERGIQVDDYKKKPCRLSAFINYDGDSATD